MTEAPRRAHILAAADRLLRHYGPGKTTVADVAREAGVGVGTVYLEFPSKEAIVEELSRARHHQVLEAMRAAATDPARDFRERLTGALDARLEAFFALSEEGAHACDLVRCVTSGVKSAQESYHAEEAALIADLLRRGHEAGELAVDDPEICARAVLRAYVTFTAPFLAGKDREEVRQHLEAMHRLLLHGLVRSAARPVPYQAARPATPVKPARVSKVSKPGKVSATGKGKVSKPSKAAAAHARRA